MTEEEFVAKMKELGWEDEYIKLKIKRHNEAKKQGIVLPYEMNLTEAPIFD